MQRDDFIPLHASCSTSSSSRLLQGNVLAYKSSSSAVKPAPARAESQPVSRWHCRQREQPTGPGAGSHPLHCTVELFSGLWS